MTKISINLPLVVTTEDLRMKIGACLSAKRVASESVSDHLDAVIDILDDILDIAVKTEEMRNEDGRM